MTTVLPEIPDGPFARNWLLANKAGAARFKAIRPRARNHQLHDVGKRLRRLMSWIDAKEV